MTTYAHSSRKCPICNTISRYAELMSTNSMGYCDLDTRPAGMQRMTMHTWLQACPKCGYVASKLSDAPTVDKDFVNSDAYKTCDGVDFKSDLAVKFYRLYLIKKHDNDARNAFWSALEAAWASDDAHDVENAVKARLAALEQLDLWMAKDGDAPNLALIKTDLLRRVRRFDAAIEVVKEREFQEDLLAKIAKLEIKLCEAQDDACHTVAKVAEV